MDNLRSGANPIEQGTDWEYLSNLLPTEEARDFSHNELRALYVAKPGGNLMGLCRVIHTPIPQAIYDDHVNQLVFAFLLKVSSYVISKLSFSLMLGFKRCT